MSADPHVEELQLRIRRLERESASHASRAERYRNILDQLPVAVARLHTDGVVGFANVACCEALGLGIEDIIGRGFSDPLRTGAACALRGGLATPEGTQHPGRHSCRHARRHPMDISRCVRR